MPVPLATGDVAFAATDDQGKHTLMCSQHVLNLGRAAAITPLPICSAFQRSPTPSLHIARA
jgi:hypothetical protein